MPNEAGIDAPVAFHDVVLHSRELRHIGVGVGRHERIPDANPSAPMS